MILVFSPGVILSNVLFWSCEGTISGPFSAVSVGFSFRTNKKKAMDVERRAAPSASGMDFLLSLKLFRVKNGRQMSINSHRLIMT